MSSHRPRRYRLGASTFKRLNLGLAALEAAYSTLLGLSIATGIVAPDANAFSNLGGSMFISLYCLYQHLSAEK